MLSNVTGWIKKLTEAGVGLVGLAIVAQVIFGSSVAFLPGASESSYAVPSWHGLSARCEDVERRCVLHRECRLLSF